MRNYFYSRSLVFLMIVVLITSLFSGVGLLIVHGESVDNGGVALDASDHPYRPGQLIVGYRQSTKAEGKRALRAEMQLELLAELHSINAEVIRVKNERALEVLSQLANNPNVAFAELNYIASVDYSPNDPQFPYQLYLPFMNTPEAWDVTKGSSTVKVAVLDTGILTNNTDLKNLNLSGYNIVDSNSDYVDEHGHGTAVTSVVAAKMDNSFGFAGIAPDSSFMMVKVIGADGSGTYSDMIQGIEYATDHGADVINMSIGGRADSEALKLAVDYAVNRGTTIVAAAGNEGTTTVSFPAAYSNVVGVGAVDTSGRRMSFSNTGSGLTVVAGGSAMVATGTDYISSATGTSFAAPYVSGLVALLYSADSSMSPDKVVDILGQTSVDLGSSGYDTTYGYGLVDMGAAVREAAGVQAPVADTTPPVLTLLGDSAMTLELGSDYVEPGAEAVDDVDGDLSSEIVISGTVNINTAGIYELSYVVSDTAGNMSNVEIRIVEVVEPVVAADTVPPVLTLLGDSQMTIELGSSYDEPGADATDDVDGDLSSQVVITGDVDVTTAGSYELSYSVEDSSGNLSNVEMRTVDVIEPAVEADTTPPILTLLGESYISVEEGGSYNEPGAEAVDDVDGDLTDSIEIIGSVDESTVGSYELTYFVSDSAGNESNIETRTVEVVQLEEIPPATEFIRDVEIVEGSINRKNPTVTHDIQISDSGILDVELSYSGKASPTISITGLDFNGTSGSFDVDQGTYAMEIASDNNVKFSVTLTYPAREVPLGVPAGPPEVTIYGTSDDTAMYILIGITLLLVVTVMVLYKKQKIRFLHR